MSRFDLGALRSRDELTAAGKDLSEEIKSDDVASLAAAVSFKIVLALFPAMLAAVAIFAMVTDAAELQVLLGNLPSDVTEIIQPQLEEFIRRAESGGIAVTGIAVGIWAATGAAATLNKALSSAYDIADDRTLVTARASALAVTVALLVALLGISVLLVAGGAIEENALATLPLNDAARSSLDLVSTVARYVLAVVGLMILFAFIYWIGPDYERRPRWQFITPGAALAVVTWLLASAAFGWYVANYGSYGEGSIYGSLGGAIVFMLWLQLSMFALLLGAEVNQVLQVRARARAASAGSRVAEPAGDGGDALPSDVVSAAPIPSRAGAHIRLPDDQHGGGSGRSPRAQDAGAAPDLVTAAATTRGAHRDRSEEGAGPAASARAVAVHDHGTAARDAWADGATAAGADARERAAADERRVPVPTLIGAAVATVSSLIGLAGLFRRLKGD